MIGGFSNRQVRERLFPSPTFDCKEAQRRSGMVSRQLRMLRAHGIIRKIKGRNLYQVSQSGRTLLTMFLLAREASAKQLMKKAA
jgi:hypothetical protein